MRYFSGNQNETSPKKMWNSNSTSLSATFYKHNLMLLETSSNNIYYLITEKKRPYVPKKKINLHQVTKRNAAHIIHVKITNVLPANKSVLQDSEFSFIKTKTIYIITYYKLITFVIKSNVRIPLATHNKHRKPSSFFFLYSSAALAALRSTERSRTCSSSFNILRIPKILKLTN